MRLERAFQCLTDTLYPWIACLHWYQSISWDWSLSEGSCLLQVPVKQNFKLQVYGCASETKKLCSRDKDLLDSCTFLQDAILKRLCKHYRESLILQDCRGEIEICLKAIRCAYLLQCLGLQSCCIWEWYLHWICPSSALSAWPASCSFSPNSSGLEEVSQTPVPDRFSTTYSIQASKPWLLQASPMWKPFKVLVLPSGTLGNCLSLHFSCEEWQESLSLWRSNFLSCMREKVLFMS